MKENKYFDRSGSSLQRSYKRGTMNIIYGGLLFFFLLSSGLVYSQNVKHPPITPKWAFDQNYN
jgi:hypothetical protein